jgi:hypothetical protein
VIEVGNYVIATPSELGNYKIADTVSTATGRITVVGASRKVFREQVSLRLADIEAAASCARPP